MRLTGSTDAELFFLVRFLHVLVYKRRHKFAVTLIRVLWSPGHYAEGESVLLSRDFDEHWNWNICK